MTPRMKVCFSTSLICFSGRFPKKSQRKSFFSNTSFRNHPTCIILPTKQKIMWLLWMLQISVSLFQKEPNPEMLNLRFSVKHTTFVSYAKTSERFRLSALWTRVWLQQFAPGQNESDQSSYPWNRGGVDPSHTRTVLEGKQHRRTLHASFVLEGWYQRSSKKHVKTTNQMAVKQHREGVRGVKPQHQAWASGVFVRPLTQPSKKVSRLFVFFC